MKIRVHTLVAVVITGLWIIPTYSIANNYEFFWMDVGIAPGRTHNTINTTGQVAVNQVEEESQSRAARWSRTEQQVLLPDGLSRQNPWSKSAAINNHGSVVGTIFEDQNQLAIPFIWTREEGIQRLPTLGGEQIAPVDINDHNYVVGWARTPHILFRTVDINDHNYVVGWTFTPHVQTRAFLWTPDSGIRDLGASSRENSRALAVNEHGVIVGFADGRNGRFIPFIWLDETGMQPIDIPSAYRDGGVARDINDNGTVIVNLFEERVEGTMHHVLGIPFMWTRENGFIELPLLEDHEDIRALEINNKNDVLLMACNGDIPDKNCIEYLVAKGVLVELPQLEEAEQMHYSSINDRGWLAGSAFIGDQKKGFIAKPVETAENWDKN